MVLVDSLGGFSLWDWGIVFLLTVSTLVSIWRGFSREAISLLGWVFSFVIANLYAGTAAISLESAIDNAMARLLASWLLIFITVLLITAFFSKMFSKVVFAVGLGFLDRLLGIVFGFARGVIIAVVLVFLGREVSPVMFKDVLSQSILVQSTEMLVDWSLALLGTDINDLLPAEK
tara:strand:- start:6943 stop:7467 length:525 start_codon:yes stop_codon:yes gene_type:complete